MVAKYPIIYDDGCGCFKITVGKFGWFNIELGKSFKKDAKITITRKESLDLIKKAIDKCLEIQEKNNGNK